MFLKMTRVKKSVISAFTRRSEEHMLSGVAFAEILRPGSETPQRALGLLSLLGWNKLSKRLRGLLIFLEVQYKFI